MCDVIYLALEMGYFSTMIGSRALYSVANISHKIGLRCGEDDDDNSDLDDYEGEDNDGRLSISETSNNG